MRTVPASLQAHLDSGVTTTCKLLKIILQGGTSTGLTNHDRAITYDSVEYSAINGFNESVIASDSSFDVDNAQGTALISGTLQGITLEMVKRGDLEGGTWEMMLINYRDLTMGHILLDRGDLGEIRIVDDMVYMPELVSFAMRLRQTIGGVWSRRCRAIFGHQVPGQLFCGVDAEALWTNGTVAAVDTDEAKRLFQGDVSEAVPARVQWLTGNNTSSRVYQIEAIDAASNSIALFEELPFPIQVGDTYRVRPDCDKRLSTCRDTYSNELEFRGEPLIPVGEASQIPGASLA